MKRMWWVLMLAAAVPLAAQEPAEPQDTAEAARLRQQIEQRFHQIVRDRLALTDDQDAKLRTTARRSIGRCCPASRRTPTACSCTCRASNAIRNGCSGCSRMKIGKWPAT